MEHAAAQDALIGVTIGNYQVKAKLGAGGMGSVYLAEHPLIGKQVALKVLHAELSANQDVITRFFNEARAVNDIKHPNIVDIIDFGMLSQQGQNFVYFIMELIEGPSLAELLRREPSLPPERAFGIAWQICDALGASHAMGIVHRDLKPDNVMLIQRGRMRDFVKVLDFGIAKLTGNPGSHQTRTGVIMGTPAYMSPEQCEGRGNIDHRTDIYALGILLYRMLTGHVPFVGEGYGEVLVQHLTQQPAWPSSIHGGIPPHVEAVVMKALEKRPDARYPNMEELMKALVDPVGYVEGHGGLGGFLAGLITPGAVAPQAPVATTGSIPPFTPAPITAGFMTPVPGQLHTFPPGKSEKMTTLSSGASLMEAAPRAGSSRATLFAVTIVALLALVGGGIFLARQGDAPHAASAPEAPGEETAARIDDTGAAQPPAAGRDDTVAPAEGTATAPVKPTDGSGGAEAVAEVPPAPENVAPENVAPQNVPPQNVAVAIASKPDGAEVFVGSEDQPRGKTPLTIEFAPSEESVTLTLKRSGYKDSVQQITPREPAQFVWSLSRARGERRPSRQSDGDRPRRGIDDSVTLQPDL